MTVDDSDNLQYYYYGNFCLVKTDYNDGHEKCFSPGLRGCNTLIIRQDERAIILDKGYDDHQTLLAFQVGDDEALRDPQEEKILFQGNLPDCHVYTSRGSKAIFSDQSRKLLFGILGMKSKFLKKNLIKRRIWSTK